MQDKGSYSSFMKKQIFEQPESVGQTMKGRVIFDTNEVILGGIKEYMTTIKSCRRLLFIACGTSYHSAIATRQLIEELTELPVVVELASDFLDRNAPVYKDDVCFFISKSGETTDTLLALNYCKARGALTVGITNMLGSSILRESHCGLDVNAGPEIGVAYTSQFVTLVMFGLMMCNDKISMQERRKEIIEGLKALPEQINIVLGLDVDIQKLAQETYQHHSLLVMGRGYNYATCLEGALKIKEVTLMHSEGISSGELKHGPLAIVDKAMPVLMIVTRDQTYNKCMNALQQIKARHGQPILICNLGDKETMAQAPEFIGVPQTIDCLQGILTIIPIQLLSLHIAEMRKYDKLRPAFSGKGYIDTGSYSSFMKKQIFEQPESVGQTMKGRVIFDTNEVILGGIKEYMTTIKSCRRLLFIACGTSYHSAIATRQLIEELTELPVVVELASDFLDRNAPVYKDDVCFFISKSGETTDTLLALNYCKARGALTVGITNMLGSSILRESHCGLDVNAGPEIGVASTKVYTSQFVTLVMFGLMMCNDKISMQERRKEIIEGLKALPEQINIVLGLDVDIQKLAQETYQHHSLLVMGRGYNYATCLEGALKIKEVTLMHSEGISSGELKHGPLAIVDKAMPVLMIVTRDQTYNKCMNALQQIKARHGQPILICNLGDKETMAQAPEFIGVPQTIDCLQGILTIIPIQLLSLHIAEMRKYDVDCPRNLTKSVTIE